MASRSGLALAVALLLAPAAAPAELDSRGLVTAIREFNVKAHFPVPPLDHPTLKKLLDGEVVRVGDLRGDSADAQRIIALVVARVPRDHVWLVVTDPHFARTVEYTGTRLSAPGARPSRSYGMLDLPWPVADRHWVVDIWTNVELATATGGRAWERWWDLAPDGLALAGRTVAAGRATGVTPEMYREAIYTPVNRGSWLAVSLPDGRTLIGYQLTSVVGGDIPQEAVREFTKRTMKRLLGGVIERAQTVPEHYGPEHAPLPGGDDRPIPPVRPASP